MCIPYPSPYPPPWWGPLTRDTTPYINVYNPNMKFVHSFSCPHFFFLSKKRIPAFSSSRHHGCHLWWVTTISARHRRSGRRGWSPGCFAVGPLGFWAQDYDRGSLENILAPTRFSMKRKTHNSFHHRVWMEDGRRTRKEYTED